ncbi:7-keto-8-aminopelargonate synthetase-like enzyme [Bradyrhizobium sp. USDA 4532]|nr:7-keto-8-aminopelargonate synthetase-like enzyme [Bradyrhizobium sp. USDA 4545]MCP1920293.1 7-keto-8-aminopelargonate synthetase-like enzyme [Bradyrhizobium sp. USDA 4532]
MIEKIGSWQGEGRAERGAVVLAGSQESLRPSLAARGLKNEILAKESDRLRALRMRGGIDFASHDYLPLASAPRMKEAVSIVT